MPRNPDKTPCSVEGCKAWAMRGSDPPICFPHSSRKAGSDCQGMVGAPQGNHNAFIHGFYADYSQPVDLEQLRKELEEGIIDVSLDSEIYITRDILSHLLDIISTGTTPGPTSRPLDDGAYYRYFQLILRCLNTLRRLVHTRQTLPERGGFQAIIDAALDGLSEEWGIDL